LLRKSPTRERPRGLVALTALAAASLTGRQLLKHKRRAAHLVGENAPEDSAQDRYIRPMFRKQLEIPPEAAEAFVRDMKAFFRKSGHEADEIAGKQAWLLKEHLPGAKLRITEVKELFLQMKDHV
jgi:hypothetical protein